MLNTHTKGHGSNPGQVKICYFFQAVATLIFYLFKYFFFKNLYFPNIYNNTSSYCLLQMQLLWIAPHESVSPPCWYFRLQEIQKHDFFFICQWHNVHTRFHPNPFSGSQIWSWVHMDIQTSWYEKKCSEISKIIFITIYFLQNQHFSNKYNQIKTKEQRSSW